MKKEESSKFSPRSKTDIKRIIELYESELSMREVGIEFGITRQRVEQILKRAGVKTRKFTKTDKFLKGRKRKRKILSKELLIKFYKDKRIPVSEVLWRLNTTHFLLYQSLEYHNIPKRITQGIKHSKLTEDLLRRLYLEENLSAPEIARRLGFATITIRKRLSEFGIRKSEGKS